MSLLDGSGWQEMNGCLLPVGFTSPQLPPALTQRSQRSGEDTGYTGDEENWGQSKVKRRKMENGSEDALHSRRKTTWFSTDTDECVDSLDDDFVDSSGYWLMQQIE